MRFIGYEDLIQRFGEPDADNYTQVFDGDLGTNDLEQIYAICGTARLTDIRLPDGSVRCGGAVR